MTNKYELERDGFQKFKLNDINFKILKSIKSDIQKISLDKKNLNKIKKLENIHQLDFDNFNSYRLEVIKKLNNIKDIQKRFFSIFKEQLIDLFGKDISVQKNINLVIQRPHDPLRANFHKDAPPNSLHEIVVWLPLVNCYDTMSMYLFKKNKLDLIDMSVQDKKFNQDSFAKKHGTIFDIQFGEFIIFWTGAFHYIPINVENDTRWSLNIRYKNTFSPYGKKSYLDYFEPINYSTTTNLATYR
tara:strand:+ start:5480 stop:6208 length:729 start_codon:yes stop_codon:yes gene_type:complete